jgi:hypothetical protein
MPLVQPSVAQVCKSIAGFLTGEFSGGDTSVRVLTGSPADAVPGDSDADHRLNLFFFRFEPAGLVPDLVPGQTQMVRLHCLATPFAVSEGSISAGENDLRIIGELIRIFQESPVFRFELGGEGFHIQVIFLNLGIDQLNQLWSTQGDTVYRPSVLLEVSLAPVIPDEALVEGPLTAAVGQEVRANLQAEPPSLVATPPPPGLMRPITSREDWTPGLVLVHDGVALQSISLELAGPALAAFTPRAWVAGAPGENVTLVWELWDSSEGWRAGDSGTPAVIASSAVDPAAAGSAPTVALALPFDDRAGQMVLYAERSLVRAADGAAITLRSNPVLINLYEAAP